MFLWSIIPITPRCLVCSAVVICNPGQSVGLIYEVFIRLKYMKVVAEIFVIPRNMSLAVLRSSLLIHFRFSDDIYSRAFYRYSLFIMH